MKNTIETLKSQFNIEVEINGAIMCTWRGDVFCGAHKYSEQALVDLLAQEQSDRAERINENAAEALAHRNELAPLTELVAVMDKRGEVVGSARVVPGAKTIEVAKLIDSKGKVLRTVEYKVSRAQRNLKKASFAQPCDYYKNSTYTFQCVE